MKLSYYGYYLSYNGRNYGFNINKLLRHFSTVNNPAFRKIQHNELEEDIFLFDAGLNSFILIQTKSQEIIKKINEATCSQVDIYNSFQRDETLGFAAYVIFHPTDFYYGIATTSGGPRNSILVDAVTRIFQKINYSNIVFTSVALISSATPQTIRRLPIVAKTVIKVGGTNTLSNCLRTFLGLSDDDSIDSFEITINPKPRGQLSQVAVDNIINRIENVGLRKYIVKGKRNLDDALTEFYLLGAGHISDNIIKGQEIGILAQIRTKLNNQIAMAKYISEIPSWHLQTSTNGLGGFISYDRQEQWQQYN